jgi:transposase
MLDPGAGKTKKAYIWAWARSHHDPQPGVIYEFCLGRGAQYPVAFLGGKGAAGPRADVERHLDHRPVRGLQRRAGREGLPAAQGAACAAHARRYFEELSRGGSSASAGGHRGDATLGADLPR